MNKNLQQQKEDKVFSSLGQWQKHYLDKDYEAKKREIAEQDVAKITTILADNAIAGLKASKH
jgi:hypothetical protein